VNASRRKAESKKQAKLLQALGKKALSKLESSPVIPPGKKLPLFGADEMK
jgi:hypothetical protein